MGGGISMYKWPAREHLVEQDLGERTVNVLETAACLDDTADLLKGRKYVCFGILRFALEFAG